MKRNLLSIAMGLSEKEIKELVRLRKDGGKKLGELRRERRKLLIALSRIDKKIAAYTGSNADEAAPVARAKRGRFGKAVKQEGVSTGRRPGRSGKVGLTEMVRNVLAGVSDPMRASDIVDALPAQGYKVKDVAAVRKRVSIVLATQKKSFMQVGRGLYTLSE